jgi:hypothetical protein
MLATVGHNIKNPMGAGLNLFYRIAISIFVWQHAGYETTTTNPFLPPGIMPVRCYRVEIVFGLPVVFPAFQFVPIPF